MKRGMEGCWEKKERGSNIIIPMILRLLGRISTGEEGEKIKLYMRYLKIGYRASSFEILEARMKRERII